uniref:Uncharacterized protein n=1 Tax=Candidatus Kentrum sp. FW TaxID=2126338 RepID=A0A450TWU2_9GAMM|nr:MAG: hypothetical protein BECKFW1821C_GA0114237_10508 [Candidatus Kentron sp. FW]
MSVGIIGFFLLAAVFVFLVAGLSEIKFPGRISSEQEKGIDPEFLVKTRIHATLAVLIMATVLGVASLAAYTVILSGQSKTECREHVHQEVAAEMLIAQLEHRFEPVSTERSCQIHGADPETIKEWAGRMLVVESLEEVFRE